MFCSQCGTYNDGSVTRCVNCQYDMTAEPGVPADKLKMPVEPVHREERKITAEPKEKEKTVEREKQMTSPVKEYTVWSIISAILFSIPFGTAAVIFSGLTNSERSIGNFDKAAVYSEKTRLFCVISSILGGIKVVAGIIVLLYFVSLRNIFGILLPF